MSDLILDVKSLNVAYPTPRGMAKVLQDVDLRIERGGALALVGESGSGKSTVLLALLGLLGNADVAAEKMEFEGLNLATRAHQVRGSKIAVVFQDPSSSLNPAISIGLQVMEPLIFHGKMAKAEARKQAIELLKEVALPRPEKLLDSYPHQLSGGMKQRVAIAMALAAKPDLLLLDEPTTALDVTVEAEILDLVAELRRKRNLTLLLVSHNLGIVDRLCESATVLYAGRVVEFGRVKEILNRPVHPYTRGLLAALPRPDHSGMLASMPGGLPDSITPPTGCNFAPRCPFASDGCEAPQNLSGDGHLVRCHRAQAVASLPWPMPENVPAKVNADAATLLETCSISRAFGAVQAVDQVSLNIKKGEILGLVGESGCGKSTLGRLMLRLVPSQGGDLIFDGAEVPEQPSPTFRREAQIVFQNPDTALNPRHRVGKILRRPLEHFGIVPRKEIDAEVLRLLELVRLPSSYADRFPHQLSGGEKQRVGIARALASRPKFIICDEAVSALDVSVQAAILNLLAELREELHLTLLFISHDMGVIGHICDRVVVMYGGQVMEIGDAREVLAPPFHPYTEALLSAVPRIGEAKRRLQLRGNPGSIHQGNGCPFSPRCHRYLGDICDRRDPPEVALSDGHRVYCHHPASELERKALVGA